MELTGFVDGAAREGTAEVWDNINPATGRPIGSCRAFSDADVDAAVAQGGLAFDHDLILRAAVERLRSKVEYTSLPAFLMPKLFTLKELQSAFEAILGRPLDKSAFRTRMLSADFLVEAGVVEGDSKRPPMGYRLKDRRQAVVFPRTFSPR